MIKHLSITVITVILILSPGAAFATSEFGFDGPSAVRPGETVMLTVQLTISEPVNAVEGILMYDASHFAVTAIDDSDSVIRLWTERPALVTPGQIRFSGIIPGGISPTFATAVQLFKVSIKGGTPGTGTMWFEDQSVYLNQPNPTLDTTRTTKMALSVDNSAPAASPPSVDQSGATAVVDMKIVTEPLLNEGRKTLVFQVQDRGNGPDTVRIRERLFGLPAAWQEVTNPYLLEDQEGFSIIELEVTDSFGNTTVHRITPPSLWFAWGAGIGIWVVLILVWRSIRARLT